MTSDLVEELSILSISEDLVPTPFKIPSQEVTLAFEGYLNPPLILQTNETECGGKLWPAGMVLAEYLLRNKMPVMEGKEMFVRSNNVYCSHGPQPGCSYADRGPLLESSLELVAALLGILSIQAYRQKIESLTD